MRIKKTAPIIITGFIVAITFSLIAIAAIDAPHNASNNISCGSCHGAALLNSPFWGGSYTPANIDDTVYNKLCLNCHRASSGPYTDTNAPLVKTHSSLSTSNKYGDWTRECRTCHDPHYQKQKNYKNTDAGNLYLATGTITSCVYNGDGTSTLTYSTITYKSGWNATKLTEKTGDYRRTILFPNVGKLGYNYPVIAVDTPTANTITVTGDATAYLYPPTTFAAMYGQYSKDSIDIKADPSVSPSPASIYKTVKFFDQVGAKSFADGDTTYNGVCEVCHTQTTHFRNDGSGSDQNHTNVGSGIPGTNCISCHSHVESFKANCNACHGYPPPSLASIPLPTGSATAGAHVLHVTTKGYQCSICHFNSTGSGTTHNNNIITLGFVSLLGTYTGGSYDGQTTANYQNSDAGTTVSKTGNKQCSNIYCHGGTMAPNGGTASAVWDNPSSAACGTCHGASTGAPPTRGSHLKHAGSAAGGKQLDCTVCHSGYTSAHLNGSVNWAYDTTTYTWLSGALYRGAASGSATPVPSTSYGTCANLYCHSQGTSSTAPFTPNIAAIWGGALDATCTGCHSGDKNAVNKMGTGSHTKHVIDSSLDCTKCHNQTVSNSRTIINQANHVNNLINVAYDGASNTGGNATYNGSTSPMTKTPGTAYGSCSNIYCHGSGTPTWGSSIAIACDGCHKASNILQGKHGAHYASATVATNRTAANNSSDTTYIFNCGACHDPGATTHGGGAVSGIRAAQVAFDATYAGGGTYTAGGTLAGTDNGFNWTAGATNNACSNTYCHSQGTSLTTPYAAPNITGFQWTSSTLTCSGCHGNPPAYANGSPKTNSHSAHSAYTCNTCHVNTTSGGTTITNKANHVNKAYNVDAGAGASFTYTYNVAGGTCSNISCHCNASIPAQWGATSACLNCHSQSCGNRAAITPQFSSNSHHIQGVSLTSAHCYQCHWEANSDGTINHTYHGGSVAPGSVVDLVIYGIGTRPTTYTAGTTAIQYTANGSRTQIKKLNTHCLSCHGADPNSITQTTDTDFRAGSFSQATLNGITGPGASVQLTIQTSAGTGAEGAYSCSGTCTIPSGTHNYTTFSVSSGATVNFSGTNPVIINATFGATVNGTLNLNGGNGGNASSSANGSGGSAGAGGSIGGSGNNNGSGSGGGHAGGNAGDGGGAGGHGGAGGNGGGDSWYGSAGAGAGGAANSDVGGSGGGGGRWDSPYSYSGGGGGGGGSLKIVSASQIIVGGSIKADGGSGGAGHGAPGYNLYAGGGGGGSGGSITLIGSTITNNNAVIGSISASGNAGGAGVPYSGGGGGGGGGKISIQTVSGTMSGNPPVANGGAGGSGGYQSGGSGASLAPTYSTVPYNSSGTFVSGPVDAGINPDAWTSVTWHTTQTTATQITLKAKSYSSKQAPNFAGCNTLATITSANANSSASLSGYSCVNPTDRYIYYQATLSGDTTGSPSLDDVTINYGSSSQQTSPFGDGKRPNQYAWDSISIGEKYSQTGTTGWGKYSGGNTTPKDTQTKAYSAHGNATANQGGWDLNETWPNTRNGTENIACFDCHNSHGSSVSGTTTSYTSATTNGGILKDTAAGKGGYSITYKPQAGGSTANKNAYNAGTGLCFDCHVNAASGTTPWGYQITFGATQAIMGYRDTAYFGPGTAPPQQRFGYKTASAPKGGHLGASSALSSTPTGTINGLCTPCHDPHGVSPTLGANMQYGVPLLKGTWITSLYKEDRAPANDVIGTIRTDKGHEGIHYQIDQNTLGSDITSSVSGITQTDTQFAGLCLNCHSKSSLTNGTNHTWKSKDRVHESVKGWKTADATIQHNYPCSKCHTPHNSGLPRLMITNCLDSRHKGFRANNTAAITSGTGSLVQCGPEGSPCYGTNDLFLGTPRLFWPGCTSQCTGVGSGRKPGNWSSEQFWAGWPGSVFHGWYHTVTCHENYDSNQNWNTKTPWVFSGLIGLRWNLSVSKEELGVIDTTTGNFTVKGTVGDLVGWSGSSVISGNTLYVIGVNSADQNKLYILNTTTGSLTSAVNLSADGLFLSGFDSSGNLIGLRWNVSTSKEEFGVINTTTGSFAVKGTVGDLVGWSGSSVISGNTLYVIGVNSADQNKLYILNTTTGSLTSTVNLSDGLTLAGFDSGGNLIGLRWNVSTSKEEFGVINTTTGSFAVKGTVGDLDGLAPPAIISGNTLYVNGQNSGGQNKLYILNTTTGSLTSTVNLSADGLFLSGFI